MIERKIIIGLIVSTEYCLQIKSIWNIQFIESVTAKRLAGWIWEYFDVYNKAPGKDIEGIYYTKLKETKLPKDLAEEIEQEILPSLSSEYIEDELNVEYLVTETKKYFNNRHLLVYTETIEVLRSEGKLEEAEQMAVSFKPLGATTGNINNFISDVRRIRKNKKKEPVTLMKSWLKEGQTTIIYGPAGSGKSLLAILIAYMLGLEEYEKFEIGEWTVRHCTGSLYIDGELGEQEMEERIRQFEWMGRSLYKMQILSIPEYQLATADTFYLSNRINQLKIIHWLKDHPMYKLVVLDSASTLFGLIEENDNSEWNNKINPFLRDLRALGVSCLLIHHAGKNNKRGLRGASSMSAMAHNIFRLVDHTSKNIDDGEAWFTLSKDKQRSAGKSFKTFSLMFTQSDDQKETHWEITSNN